MELTELIEAKQEKLIPVVKWLIEEFLPKEKERSRETYDLKLLDQKIVLTKTGSTHWLIGSWTCNILKEKLLEHGLSYIISAKENRSIEIDIS